MIGLLNKSHVICNPMCLHWLQTLNEFYKSPPFPKEARKERKDNRNKE